MNEFSGLAKMIISLGFFLIIVGGLFLLLEKIGPFGRLPGDIYYKKGTFTFYFPLATSIILSIALTIILNYFFRR